MTKITATNDQDTLMKKMEEEDREPLDTGGMIANSLKQHLGNPSEEYLSQINDETQALEDTSQNTSNRITQAQTSSEPSQQKRVQLPDGVSTENMLVALYSLYDDTIEAFEEAVQLDEGSHLSKKIQSLIQQLSTAIGMVGGKVEPFDPLDHISGLQIPEATKNAEQVAENTKKYYTKGLVKAGTVSDNDATIEVAFSGTKGDIAYSAMGKIKAESWDGNEAIDYVYTSDGGKMTVKRLTKGRWVDISDNFEIMYELFENSIEEENNEENEKEDLIDLQNNDIIKTDSSSE